MWVGLIQLVESLNKTKRQIIPLIKGNFLCLTALSWDILFLLPSDLNWNNGSFWVLSFLAFGLEFTPLVLLVLGTLDSDCNYITGSPGPPAFCVQIVGFFSPHNCVSQFLVINPLSLCIYVLLVLFLWRTMTNTPSKFLWDLQPKKLSACTKQSVIV